MATPDFLIIGAQKCGTTWLHQNLRMLPRIFMPPDKDPALFFNDPNEAKTYSRRFDAALSWQLIGDACAGLFWTRFTGPYPAVFNPDISRAVFRHLGAHLKLIILVKDPVHRAVSGYLHHIAHGTLSANCPIVDAPGELGIVALSRFGQHLECWLESYPASQTLVLPSPSDASAEFLLNAVHLFLRLHGDMSFERQLGKVFPGLLRRNLDDGVWVALDQAGVDMNTLQRAVPMMEHEGRRFVRLIHRDELQYLEETLADDTRRFARLVHTHGWHHPAFVKWRSWPR